jgi:MarR family transcriptional regulator for hemolysin
MDDPTPQNVRQAFGRRLGLTARQWRRAIDQRLQPFGLTEATWQPLLYIARSREPMLQKNLAASLGIECSTLVRLIDALDHAGLIERQTGGDRRSRTLHVTPRGRALVEQVEAAAPGIRAQVLADVSDAELATTLSVFEKICAGLTRERTSASADAA